METNLNLFYNEEANVTIRTQQLNNEPWFVAKDVANALDIAWSGATLSNIPDDWKGMMSFNTPSYGDRGGGVQQLSVINEAALYKLAFRSNKPQADAFVNWVAGEVLPQLRQSRAYRTRARRVHAGATTAPAPAPPEVPPVLRGMEAAGEALYQPERVGRGGRRYRC